MYGFRVWLILAVRMSDPSDPQAHTLLYPQSNMAMESLTFIDNFPIATSFYRDFPASHVWLSGGDVHCKNYTYHCVVASGWHQKDPWSKPFCRPKTASEVATSLFLWRVSPRGEIEKNDLVAASHLDRFLPTPGPSYPICVAWLVLIPIHMFHYMLCIPSGYLTYWGQRSQRPQIS